MLYNCYVLNNNSQQTPNNSYIIVSYNFPLNNIIVTCYVTVLYNCYMLYNCYVLNNNSQQTPNNSYIIVSYNFSLNNITVICYVTVT